MSRHLGKLREYLRGSLWVMPTVSVVAAIVLGVVLVQLDFQIETGTFLDEVVFGGGAEGARAVLEMVAGSVITITSLVFTLTVVALQLAASNYSPRILRNFLRDRGTQATLSIFLATFAYSYIVLRTIRSQTDEQEAFVPELAVTVLLAFVLASIAALVYFIHHITQSMRVDTILRSVAADTLETIDRVHPDDAEEHPAADPVPESAVTVLAAQSGVVQDCAPRGLVRRASEDDLVVRFVPLIGDHVLQGTPLAWAWPREDGELPESEELQKAVNGAVQFGSERTMQHDVGFGIRQLVDVALRALSTGLNDPTTATQALEHVGDVLGVLAARQLAERLERDEHGITRVIVARPGFADYLALACDQIRIYGADDPVVMGRVERMLDDLEHLTDDPERLEAIAAKRA